MVAVWIQKQMPTNKQKIVKQRTQNIIAQSASIAKTYNRTKTAKGN